MLTQLTEYHRPDKMSQALRLLVRRDVVTAPLAGGTWLVAQRELAIEAALDLTPFDKGAYASSTTFVSGGAVKKAAEKVAGMIKDVAGRLLEASP
jgi:putative selenate reductase molybdopterin-binding subunit